MSHRRFLPFICVALCAVSSRARAADSDDLVLLSNGGRVRGEVIEEDPQRGTRIKLVDGSIRSLKPSEVREVHYQDAAPTATAMPTAIAATPAAPPSAAPIVPPVPALPNASAPVASAPASAVPTVPLPAEAAAERRFLHKVDIAARLGFALPMGSFSGGDAVSDMKLSGDYTGQIPIGIDLGYWLTPRFMFGMSLQYGAMLEKSGTCARGSSCSDHDIRFGWQGQYHFSPAASTDPWLGFGFGYEILNYSVSTQQESYSGGYSGPQYLNLQAGTDFDLNGVLSLGPVLAFSVAEFKKESFQDQTVDIDNTALHEWLTLSVKGSLRL